MGFLLVGIPLLVSLAGLAAVFWFGSGTMIIPKRRALEQRHLDLLETPSEFGLHLEPFEAETGDGFWLKGFLATPIPLSEMGTAERTRRMQKRLSRKGITSGGPNRGTIVLLHGRGGLKENMLTVAQRFVAADFRCVVYDARAHGVSEGKYTTYGDREVDDLSRVLDHVESILMNRGENTGPVFGFGLSLGAAVLLQSLEREKRIRAAVAVAPFGNLRKQMIFTARKMSFQSLPEWIPCGVARIAGWRAGFDPFTISPEKSAVGVLIPIFIVHGAKDKVIPLADSRTLFQSLQSPEKQWREISGGSHRNVLAEGGDELYEEMIEFYLR